MKFHRFLAPALVLAIAAGCGPTNMSTPSGVVYEGKYTSEWGDTLTSADPQARLHAAKVLVKMGEEGKNTNPAILGLHKAAVDDEDPIIRGWAAVALVYAVKGTPFPIAQIAGPILKQATESSDAELRVEAGKMLEQLQSAPAGPPGRPGGPGTSREGGDAPSSEKKPSATEKGELKKP
jgi:hypothetical protein